MGAPRADPGEADLRKQARAERPHREEAEDVKRAGGSHREMDHAADAGEDLEGAAAMRNAKEGAGKANDLLPGTGDPGGGTIQAEHRRLLNRTEPIRPPNL
jgi:hypothetical protein